MSSSISSESSNCSNCFTLALLLALRPYFLFSVDCSFPKKLLFLALPTPLRRLRLDELESLTSISSEMALILLSSISATSANRLLANFYFSEVCFLSTSRSAGVSVSLIWVLWRSEWVLYRKSSGLEPISVRALSGSRPLRTSTSSSECYSEPLPEGFTRADDSESYGGKSSSTLFIYPCCFLLAILRLPWLSPLSLTFIAAATLESFPTIMLGVISQTTPLSSMMESYYRIWSSSESLLDFLKLLLFLDCMHSFWDCEV